MAPQKATPDEQRGADAANGEATREHVWAQVDKKQGFPDPLLELIAARFRLLGEPLRLKLLATLTSGERSVGELASLTGAGQPNVSKHLAALAQGGLVSRRKVGTTIYYAIADPLTLTLCDVVCKDVQERFAAQARALGLRTTTNPSVSATSARKDGSA